MEQSEKRRLHRDFFLHLTAFITLYWSMIALLTIFFQLINHVLPDAFDYAPGVTEGLRWGLSGVIVAFPVFVGIMVYFRKRQIKRPNFPIYFTLFVTALTAIIDIATLVYRLTGGDITLRFGLKVLAVLVVTGSVFAFEMWHLKRKSFDHTALTRGLTGLAYVVVIAAVVLGFVVVGSPATQRSMLMDQERIQDFRTLQYEILNYYDREEALPEDLSEFRGSLTKDPQTDEPYGYTVLDEDTFELCAVFDNNYEEETRYRDAYYSGPYAESSERFEYTAGESCFERTVEREAEGGYFRLK